MWISLVKTLGQDLQNAQHFSSLSLAFFVGLIRSTACRRYPALGTSVSAGLALCILLISVSTWTGWAAEPLRLDFGRLQSLAAQRYDAAAAQRVSDWNELLQTAATLEAREQLERVNTFFNRRMRFVDDVDIWQQNDYWATPLESLGRAAGDCEDYAIAKYVSLLALGVPPEQLRLIYVRASFGRPGSAVSQAHMVVGWYATPDAEPLVLDNLISEIRPASRRPDLFPVFSFNSEGLWVAGSNQSTNDPTARLSRWRDVLERMRADGIAI